MKIAVTYEDGKIFQHFGHTEEFKIYEIQDGKVIASEVVPTNGSGHGALAGFLTANGVGALICGGIGPGAQMALAEMGISLYAGVAGSADTAVQALLMGCLQYSTSANCNHHDHDHHHGGSCGSHGCGSHDHGHSCGSHCGH
ncbi:MAG: NifB/NifX family molybdenum-iron cluster-binding protein [Lachnospiraceae bacterium]|nr:NifB/NifX family molybdenum-iron cluster-binding protein [Lachnospiraceae bacterium]